MLELDLGAPVGGWPLFLAGSGIVIQADDLGRAAIGRDAARQLFTERREAESKAREHAAAVELQAIETERQFRAGLYQGISAHAVPGEVTPAAAMLQAVHDARPRRRSLLDEALSQSSLVFHPLNSEDEL